MLPCCCHRLTTCFSVYYTRCGSIAAENTKSYYWVRDRILARLIFSPSSSESLKTFGIDIGDDLINHKSGLKGQRAISPGQRPGKCGLGELSRCKCKSFPSHRCLCFCPCRAQFLLCHTTQGAALGYELIGFSGRFETIFLGYLL